MSRYTDIDKLIKSMQQLNPIGDIGRVTIEECIAQIKYADVADVRENVRGEWIERCEIDGGFGATCNICGEYCALQYTDDRKFCPNCGADMRKEERIKGMV